MKNRFMKNWIRSTFFGLTFALGANLSAGTLFFGAYPNSLLVFDEAQGKVVDRIMLETGLPTSIRLSQDKKKIYVTTNDHAGLEVVDVASRKVISHLTLNSGPRRYRFNGGVADANDKLFYTVTTEITVQTPAGPLQALLARSTADAMGLAVGQSVRALAQIGRAHV